MNQSEFSYHEACPKCGSCDNVARYTDGHGWCFGCSTFFYGGQEAPTIEVTRARSDTIRPELDILKEVAEQVFEDSQDHWNLKTKPLDFPDDYMRYLPDTPQQWLRKYEITAAEVNDNQFGWSNKRQMMIMPVRTSYPDGRLLMWQGRGFNPKRYHTGGPCDDVIHVIGNEKSDTIILVEDLISAIKVGRYYTCIPLFGSAVSVNRLNRLVKLTNTSIGIWLDSDKAKAAMEFRQRLAQYLPSFCIITQNLQSVKHYFGLRSCPQNFSVAA